MAGCAVRSLAAVRRAFYWCLSREIVSLYLMSTTQTFRAPSMGAVLRVQVPPKGDHPERSKPQLRKGDRPWEGSGERSRGPMNKNRIRGGDEWGKRANDREAPMVKTRGRRSGGRAVKDSVLTWGDLALCLKGRREGGARSQQRS
jgi:hypothetical protein